MSSYTDTGTTFEPCDSIWNRSFVYFNEISPPISVDMFEYRYGCCPPATADQTTVVYSRILTQTKFDDHDQSGTLLGIAFRLLQVRTGVVFAHEGGGCVELLFDLFSSINRQLGTVLHCEPIENILGNIVGQWE